MSPDKILRLNKHLAFVLGVSRREADNLIASKKVLVNGQVVTLGARFQEGDKITVNGKELSGEVEYQYVAMNKPIGYVSSRAHQGDSPTIYDLLPENLHNLKTVGRLDRESSGLILLTNDGDFTFQMTHPSFAKVKIYQVCLDRDLEPLHQQMISDYGIDLDDGKSKLILERANEKGRTDWIVTMHEGRNRQIRRTFGALGYTVTKLNRTNFGNYALGDIKPGEFEVVNAQ
jgi:23S rRNA pseudouridine2605 synthase